MDFVFGNLPDGANEQDIKELVSHHKLTKVEFFDSHHTHSSYECLISLDISNPVVGSILEKHLNNICWKGSQISFHRLIF